MQKRASKLSGMKIKITNIQLLKGISFPTFYTQKCCSGHKLLHCAQGSEYFANQLLFAVVIVTVVIVTVVILIAVILTVVIVTVVLVTVVIVTVVIVTVMIKTYLN